MVSRERAGADRTTLARGEGREQPRGATFALELGAQRLLVAEGEHIIGRGSDCDIVLDCEEVSRRHARLTVTATNAFIEDLDSVNGVKVNGQPIRGKTLVASGSRIGFAKLEVVLVQRASRDARATRRVPLPTRKRLASGEELSAGRSEAERRGRAFEILGNVVDKALALGQPEKAERVMGALLREVLEEAECGCRLPQGLEETAALQALKLANAIGSAYWTCYPLRLYLAMEQVLPTAMIDQLYALVHRGCPLDAAVLGRYAGVLATIKLGPAQRFGLQRLRTLEQMLRSR